MHAPDANVMENFRAVVHALFFACMMCNIETEYISQKQRDHLKKSEN